MNPETNKIILYTAPNGDIRVDVYIEDETVWLTQKSMDELFGVEVHTVNYHLKETYKSAELREDSTIRKIRIVQQEGNRQVNRGIEYASVCGYGFADETAEIYYSYYQEK